MAGQMENQKLETNVLSVIPTWSDRQTQHAELAELVNYYKGKGVSAEKLRTMALNGQAGKLYSDWKQSKAKPTTITTKRRGRKDSRVNQIQNALASIGRGI